jgi:uncharacterized membrane protein YuzA (DUF378 family)
MDSKTLAVASKWILVVGGLGWAYMGYSRMDLFQQFLGDFAPMLELVVFGLAALYLAYHLLTMKGKKK